MRERGTDDRFVRVVRDACFQVERDIAIRLPVDIHVGTDSPVLIGREGIAIEYVVLVGVDAGIITVGVEIGKAELCFEVFFQGSVREVLIDEESGFFFFLFGVAGVSGSALQFEMAGKGINKLKPVFLFDPCGGNEFFSLAVFGFVLVFDAKVTFPTGMGVSEFSGKFFPVAGEACLITGSEEAEIVIISI